MVQEKGNTESDAKKAILKRRKRIVLAIVLGGMCGFYVLRFLLLDFLLNLLFSGPGLMAGLISYGISALLAAICVYISLNG